MAAIMKHMVANFSKLDKFEGVDFRRWQKKMHFLLSTMIRYLNLSTCLWMIRGGETMSDSVFKHDLCKLVIAKIGSAITYDCTRGTESGEERFKKFANNSGVIGGE
ncbi:hypothetical protein Tco_1071286, partial [Tanacetum coccineum]